MTRRTIGIMERGQLPPEALIGHARQAEALGYDEFWLIEDSFYAGGIATTATALAVTSTITVGLGIMPAVVRNAAFTAMEIAALARMHPGRVRPGFGHGVAEWIAQVGETPPSALAALEETLLAVRALLAGESVTTTGRTVNLDAVRLDHPPFEPPPVLVGVQGPKSLRLAGRSADGTILAEPTAPEYVRWARERITEGQAEAGRTEHHDVIAYTWLSVDADRDRARDAMRPSLATTLMTQMADAHFAPMGLQEDITDLRSRAVNAADFAQQMPTEWIDRLTVVGTPEDCAAAIAALHDAGADSVVLVPLIERFDEQIRLAAEQILPLLRRRPLMVSDASS